MKCKYGLGADGQANHAVRHMKEISDEQNYWSSPEQMNKKTVISPIFINRLDYLGGWNDDKLLQKILEIHVCPMINVCSL